LGLDEDELGLALTQCIDGLLPFGLLAGLYGDVFSYLARLHFISFCLCNLGIVSTDTEFPNTFQVFKTATRLSVWVFRV
jgi:hypothetical protein